MDKPKVSVECRDFGGIQLSADPHDLQPGEAADQVNIQSNRVGSMETRPGMRAVSFEYEA